MTRVSRLLTQYGLVDGAWWTEEARARGQAVHDLAEGYWTHVPVAHAPEYAGYLTAIAAASRALGFVPVRVEHRISSGTWGVTGRPDAIGYLPTAVGEIPAGRCVVDIKSGDPEPCHRLQLALYTTLADQDDETTALFPIDVPAPWSRIGIYVRATGRYSLKYYPDYNDLTAAEALVTITNWRLAHGLLTSQSTIGIPTDDPAVDA